jgi:hypothetical protein
MFSDSYTSQHMSIYDSSFGSCYDLPSALLDHLDRVTFRTLQVAVHSMCCDLDFA